jgi:phospholipid/cholesterol/gamma-HCH transport system ATP-binding protein
MAMIKITNLHKSFGAQKVLTGVDLELMHGQTLALIGASGKGKSVLLKHIIGLMAPDEGTIVIDGMDISTLYGKKREQLKERMGIVFQFGALFDSLSVYENVAFPLREKRRLNSSKINERVLEELTKVGLENDVDKFPSQISGGMRKRLALARCLALDPQIVFFDEPTTGLDPVIAASIYRIIKNLQNERKLTALIVSHEIPGIFKVVDRVAMLHDGRIIQSGTPEEIQNSHLRAVQQFLTGELE